MPDGGWVGITRRALARWGTMGAMGTPVSVFTAYLAVEGELKYRNGPEWA